MNNFSLYLTQGGYSESLVNLIIYNGQEFGFILSDLCNVVDIPIIDLNKSIQRQKFVADTYDLLGYMLPDLKTTPYEYYFSKKRRVCVEEDKFWVNQDSVYSLQNILLDAIRYNEINLDIRNAIILGMSCEDMIRTAMSFKNAISDNKK